jgi:hypothetical protein
LQAFRFHEHLRANRRVEGIALQQRRAHDRRRDPPTHAPQRRRVGAGGGAQDRA